MSKNDEAERPSWPLLASAALLAIALGAAAPIAASLSIVV
jgi:hypothetical protein